MIPFSAFIEIYDSRKLVLGGIDHDFCDRTVVGKRFTGSRRLRTNFTPRPEVSRKSTQGAHPRRAHQVHCVGGVLRCDDWVHPCEIDAFGTPLTELRAAPPEAPRAPGG